MTAATPGPPPRDRHDGQVTPGQAAYETFPRAPWEDGLTPSWETMSEADRGYWHRAAQAAIDAATEGTLRACGYTLADVGRFLEAEAAPQPAPDLEAAFASGARVRTAPCPAEGHDGEHFQVRTNGHWLCGHLLADLLIAQGIGPQPVPQPAPELAAAMAERDKAYRERAQLVAFLAACYQGEIWTDTDGGGWDVVAVETPAGQMSWHIAQADMDLFAHVTLRSEEDRYDGHTTEVKYERLAEMTSRIASAGGFAGLIASMAKPERTEPYVTTRERDEAREQLGVLQDRIGNLAAGLRLSADSSRPSKKSEIEDGCASALLGILDPR